MFKRWIGIIGAMALAWSVAGAAAAVQVRTVQAGDTYGIDNLMLENQFLRAVVSPQAGGRIISLIDKQRNQELVHWDNKLKQGGLLSLIPGGESYPGTLVGQPCTFELVEQGPDTGLVRLTSQGDSASTRGLQIVREVSLKEGAHALTVTLKVRNTGFSPRELRLRVHNWIAIGSDARKANMAVLTARGVVYEPQKPITDFVNGWMILSDAGGGLAARAAYDQMESKMFWPMADSCTMEWIYAPTRLEGSAVWESTIEFTPFSGKAADRFAKALGAGLSGAIPVPEKHPPAPRIEQRQTLAIGTATQPRAAQSPKHKRILVLSQWDYGNAAWADAKAFPEIQAYVKPMPGTGYNYNYYFGQIIYAQRWAYHARESFAWFLRDNPAYQVDVAYETNYLQYLAHLYDYDLLVVNDFPAGALEPYLSDLKDYADSGRTIVFWGGYQAFGGRGADFGNWRGIESLLPVQILTTPDWVRQTPFRETDWSADADSLRRRAMARPDPYGAPVSLRRIGPIVTCANFWHDSEWAWMRHGKTAQPTDALNPITAGLDWDAIAPDYHKVKASPDARVLARVGNDPLLVAQDLGKGRVLAVMLSDERKLYFWSGARQLFEQIADWATKQGHPVLAVKSAEKSVAISAANPTAQPVEGTLHVRATGANFEVLLDQSEPFALVAGAQGEKRLDLPPLPPGTQIEATWAGRRALQSIPYPASGEAAQPVFNFHHRHVYLPGETITVAVAHPGQLTVRDQSGRVMWQQTLDAPGTIQIPTTNWALGAYALGLTSDQGTDAERLELVHAPNVTAPIIWGGGPPFYSAEDSFLMMASLQRIADYGATAAPVGSFNSHAYGAADYCLKLGLRAIIRSGQASYYPPLEEASRQKVAELFSRLGQPYAQYPAVKSIYVDDEGTAYYWKDWDKRPPGALEAAFEQQYHRPLRQVPQTRQEQLELARFFDWSYNQWMEQMRQAVQSLRPDLMTSYVISPHHSGLLGSYVPADFKYASRNEIDVYPTSVTGLGEDLFTFAMLGALSRHNGRPTFVWPSEYRNRPDSIRMQVWAMMMNGINGWRWYAFGDGERTGVYRQEVIDTIAPLDRLAKSMGPAVQRWQADRPRIAVLYPREVLAVADVAGKKMPWEAGGDRKTLVQPYPGYSETYQQTLEALMVQLVRHDLSADILPDDRLDQLKTYDAVIVSYVDQWLPPTLEAVSRYAAGGGKVLRWASKKYDTQDRLPAARPLDEAAMKALAQSNPPPVVTPEPTIMGRLLSVPDKEAQPARFLILYNHAGKPAQAHARLTGPAAARFAVDAATHEVFPLSADGTLAVSLGAYDGRLFQLLAQNPAPLTVQATPQSLHIALPQGQTAGTVVEVSVESPAGPLWSDRYWVGPEGLDLPTGTGLNAPPGRWRITARDVAANQITEQVFTFTGGTP